MLWWAYSGQPCNKGKNLCLECLNFDKIGISIKSMTLSDDFPPLLFLFILGNVRFILGLGDTT